MKNLTIVYNGVELFSGGVDDFTWQDSPSGVTVSGKTRSAKPANGLMNMISQASRAKTDAVVAEKKAEIAAEGTDD